MPGPGAADPIPRVGLSHATGVVAYGNYSGRVRERAKRRADGHDAALAGVGGTVAVVAVLRRELDRAVTGLPPGRVVALAVLGECDGLSVSEVADRLHVEVSVASRQAAHREAAGLLVGPRTSRDGRCQLLTVTPAGLDWSGRVAAVLGEYLAGLLANWPEPDVTALTAALARLRVTLSATDRPSTTPVAPGSDPGPGSVPGTAITWPVAAGDA